MLEFRNCCVFVWVEMDSLCFRLCQLPWRHWSYLPLTPTRQSLEHGVSVGSAQTQATLQQLPKSALLKLSGLFLHSPLNQPTLAFPRRRHSAAHSSNLMVKQTDWYDTKGPQGQDGILESHDLEWNPGFVTWPWTCYLPCASVYSFVKWRKQHLLPRGIGPFTRVPHRHADAPS